MIGPDGYTSEQVRVVLAAKIKTLPDSLRLSLTWGQGPEMRGWKHVAVEGGIEIYFCDPHSPWQRGTNVNTACWGSTFRPRRAQQRRPGLGRPEAQRPTRKRLAFRKPIELIGGLLLQ